MKEKTCCFIGHRCIQKNEMLVANLKEVVLRLITGKGIDTFLFGRKGEFDRLCYEIVSECKKEYPHIRRVYVRAEFPYILESFEKHLLEYYESTYYPSKIVGAGKSVYIKRNCFMIDNAACAVFYFDQAYTPQPFKNEHSKKSGTQIAYQYAKRKGILLENIAEL